MFIKNKTKVLTITIIILTLLFLTGCLGSSTDETQIKQIAKNIEKAIEKKNVNLFMENISYNYSDEDGGTYDNHINGFPEDIISQIELAEDLVGSIPGLKIVVDVSIPENELIIVETFATGKMEINISLKICFIGCIPIPWIDAEETMLFNVDFIKEDDDWKIISLSEI